MPRRPRIVLPDVPLHVIQRGNNRQACFFAGDDYRAYLGWLEKYAREVHCTVHAYVLPDDQPCSSAGDSVYSERSG